MPMLRPRDDNCLAIVAQPNPASPQDKSEDESEYGYDEISRNPKRKRCGREEIAYQNSLRMSYQHRRILGYETCVYADLTRLSGQRRVDVGKTPMAEADMTNRCPWLVDNNMVQIEDFLGLPWEVRQLVYQFALTTETGTFSFTGHKHLHSIHRSASGAGLNAALLRVCRQVSQEGLAVLYGKTKFIAESPGDLFLPGGLQALRSGTTQLIRELSFELSHTVDVKTCWRPRESAGEIAEPILAMLKFYPGLRTLKRLSIRREILRDDEMNWGFVQGISSRQARDSRGLLRGWSQFDQVCTATASILESSGRVTTLFGRVVFVKDARAEEVLEADHHEYGKRGIFHRLRWWRSNVVELRLER